MAAIISNNRFSALAVDVPSSSARFPAPKPESTPKKVPSPASPAPVTTSTKKSKVNSTPSKPKMNGNAKEPSNAQSQQKRDTTESKTTVEALVGTVKDQSIGNAKETVQSALRERTTLKKTPKGSENANGKYEVGKSQKAVKQQVDWEIPRKTLHSSIGFIVLYLYTLEPKTLKPLLTVLISGLVCVTLIDFVRLNVPSFAKHYEALLGPLMRESEKTKINGVIWYLIGVIFVLSVYPRDIAVLSILTLSWSDTAASVFGRMFGSSTPSLPSHVPGLPFLPFAKRKSFAGFLAAAITGFAISLGFWWNGTHTLSGDYGHWEFLNGKTTHGGLLSDLTDGLTILGKPFGLWLTALILGVGGATVESIDIGYDDNLTLPIFTGALVWTWFTLAAYIF